ncbi:MAG TPA: MYXO-CTERM sorting domain-containing protein, partial [Kofleriaceae bacterium]
YAIRHAWTGPISCANPVRGRWGAKDGEDVRFGPPPRRGKNPLQADREGIKPALDLAYAPRGTVKLENVVAQDVPELGMKALTETLQMTPATTPARGSKKTGCGCNSGEAGGGLTFGVLLLLLRRRRR